MSRLSLPRLGSGAIRAIGVIGVSLALLLGNAMSAHADGAGVTSSDPLRLDAFAMAVALTPDRLYYEDGSFDSTVGAWSGTPYVSSISMSSLGPKLSARSILGPARASGVFASAGRALTVDISNKVVLLDRGSQTGTSLLLPQRASSLLSLSGSWYLSGGLQTMMTSLNGSTSDLSAYTSHTDGSTSSTYNSVIDQLGSLFLVETETWSTSGGSFANWQSGSVTVRDAANGNAIVGKTLTLSKPPTNAQWPNCYLQIGEVDCGWNNWNGTTYSTSAWVTRLNYVTQTVSTVSIPAPTGSVISGFSGFGDGFVIAETSPSTSLSGPGTLKLYAYNLNNLPQSVELDGDYSAATSGSLVTLATYDATGSESLRVVNLPFGGGSAPTLIGVVGGAAVSTVAPLKLDLDLSKPVAAGSLTIKDPSGKVVATVVTPATPDGSLRGLSWTPLVSSPLGKYTWTLNVKDSLGQLAVANVGSGAASGSFMVVPSCSQFSDVTASNQFAPHICWMAANSITKGMTETTYAPKGNVTREAMAAFMYRLAGVSYSAPSKPSFTDVTQTGPNGNQFFTEIEWMNAKNITHGMQPGQYAPKAPVTREAMAAFLYRLAGAPTYSPPSKPSFPDVSNDKTSKYYNQFYKEIEWMNAKGITTGMADGTYAPKQPVTREAMAAFMWRMSNQKLYCTTYSTGIGCP